MTARRRIGWFLLATPLAGMQALIGWQLWHPLPRPARPLLVFGILFVTAHLAVKAAKAAIRLGQPWTWGLLGTVNLLGVAAVCCLPDRRRQTRGFPIELASVR